MWCWSLTIDMYERFAPQDASGRSDPRGLRSFVVGTGGGPLYPLKSVQPNSEVREHLSWGVLKMILRGRSYDWEFLPITGQTFRDSGTAQCVVPSEPRPPWCQLPYLRRGPTPGAN